MTETKHDCTYQTRWQMKYDLQMKLMFYICQTQIDTKEVFSSIIFSMNGVFDQIPIQKTPNVNV